MHEYVSMWEHGLFQHPGMPMPPWPAQRRREQDHRRRCRRTCPAVCDLANSTHSYLLCLASRNQRPVLHTWSLPNVTHWDKAEGGCVVQEKKNVFFCTVDWRSDNNFSVLFFARPPFKANILWMFFLTCHQVRIHQDNFRISPVCCIWIGMKLAWCCTCLPGLLFALGMLSIPSVIFPQNYTASCILNCFQSPLYPTWLLRLMIQRSCGSLATARSSVWASGGVWEDTRSLSKQGWSCCPWFQSDPLAVALCLVRSLALRLWEPLLIKAPRSLSAFVSFAWKFLLEDMSSFGSWILAWCNWELSVIFLIAIPFLFFLYIAVKPSS